jgi:5,10-methylenetetrahydromethanopterin reductase
VAVSTPALGLNRWDWTSLGDFAASVARAEELGYGWALQPSGPLGMSDVYVMLTLAAQATSTIRLAPFIDNPVTRHPASLAGSIATLDEVSGGRAALVLGVGDTAVRSLNLAPARVAELEAATTFARGLLAGASIDVGAPRPAALRHPRPVPVWIAAGGPRTLRMAGRVGDGVYVRVGRYPANLRAAVDEVRAGAVEAGRDPHGIAIGLVIHTVTPEGSGQVAAISRAMAAGFYEYSPMLFKTAGLHWNGPPVDELKTRVWPDFHHAADLATAGAVVGFLPDEAADSFALFGSPADIAGQLRRAIDVLGRVDVVVPHPVPTPRPDDDFARWFAERVWPLV